MIPCNELRQTGTDRVYFRKLTVYMEARPNFDELTPSCLCFNIWGGQPNALVLTKIYITSCRQSGPKN